MNNLFWNTLIFGFMSARRAYIHTYASNVEKSATMWNQGNAWREVKRILTYLQKDESALLQLKPHDMCVLMHVNGRATVKLTGAPCTNTHQTPKHTHTHTPILLNHQNYLEEQNVAQPSHIVHTHICWRNLKNEVKKIYDFAVIKKWDGKACVFCFCAPIQIICSSK